MLTRYRFKQYQLVYEKSVPVINSCSYLYPIFGLPKTKRYFASCTQQDHSTPATTGGTYYLASIEERSDDSSFVNHTGFEYDNSGRITSFFATPTFEGDNYRSDKITYNGNEAVMILTIPPYPFPGLHSADTIWFTMDNDNKALKRIHYHFDEDDGFFRYQSPFGNIFMIPQTMNMMPQA